MNRILIVPNSFKECANSVDTALLIKENFTDSRFKIILKPVSDGGDGFLEVCRENYDLEIRPCEISSPYSNDKIICKIGADKTGKTVYVESAKVLGLNLIPPGKRKPMELNSKGLGEVFNFVQQKYPSAEKVIIGIGGTGTNDLGLGAAGVFGLRLLDADGNNLEIIPRNYIKAHQLVWKNPILPFKFEIIVDVDNSLLGETGAAKTFAKQKGASDDDIEVMEKGFANILNLLKGNDLLSSSKKLNGAGGGLAAGLQVFFNAEIKYANNFILADLNVKDISPEDLIVITGEGKFDSQSLMNKAPGIIIENFKDSQAQVFVICGIAEENIENKISGNVKVIEMKKYFSSAEESIKNFTSGLQKACSEIKNFL
ncbi:MAG: glycerate kinase [Ignavibacteriaceae bacterium]